MNAVLRKILALSTEELLVSLLPTVLFALTWFSTPVELAVGMVPESPMVGRLKVIDR